MQWIGLSTSIILLDHQLFYADIMVFERSVLFKPYPPTPPRRSLTWSLFSTANSLSSIAI